MASGATRGRHASGPERGIGQFIVYALLVVFVVAAGLRWRSQQEVREVRILGVHSLAESEVRQVLDSSLVPRKVLILRCCLIHLKNSSTCHRCR